MPLLRLSVIAGACLGIALLPACEGGGGAGGSGSENLLRPGQHADASAEWDDLDAAIAHVAEQYAMAVVSTADEPGDVRRYDLVTNTDEPVRITFRARRLDDAPNDIDDAVPTDIEVQVGVFGEPSREAAILRTLRDRLTWLRARD
ncbi:MAG: hypothetical protein ACF8QF_09290 [Phycisphaerales bacterium]